MNCARVHDEHHQKLFNITTCYLSFYFFSFSSHAHIPACNYENQKSNLNERNPLDLYNLLES